MKYVYYHPQTMQIEAIFDTPNLSVQFNWKAKGLFRAVVPEDMNVTQNHRIVSVSDTPEPEVESSIVSRNPIQPNFTVERAAALLRSDVWDRLYTRAQLTVSQRVAVGYRTPDEINAIFDTLENPD